MIRITWNGMGDGKDNSERGRVGDGKGDLELDWR